MSQKYVKIDYDEAQKIIDYLGFRPCREVFDLVKSLKDVKIEEVIEDVAKEPESKSSGVWSTGSEDPR